MKYNDPRIEALAESWASIDGKLALFRRGKTAKSITAYGGHYAGYIADAEELVLRLHNRGFDILVMIKGKRD
jgi:hypothetical protein